MSAAKIIGPDGVQQIYPTAKNSSEFYLNQQDPYKGGAHTSRPEGQFNISYGHGSQFPFTKKTEGSLTYFNTEGSPITYASGAAPGRSTRLDVYAAGGKWQNTTKYSWENNPGFLYKAEGIGSGEFTVFIRTHGDLGTHQAYACKIGGRDEDDIRSLIEMVYPTASHSSVQINYNYLHFPYVNAKAKLIGSPPKLVAEKWIGIKCVHKIAVDKKSTDWELWYDSNPFDSTGKINNNWQLAATYTDKGTPEYKNIPLTWKAHKNLCRVDGFKNVDFCLISDREIDFMSQPTPTPEPTPTPTPTPTPDREADQEARIKRLEESEFGKQPPPTPTPEPTPTPTPPVGTDTPLTVVTATGSTPDGTNLPGNAIDNDPNTRFSSLGVGSFLKLDFGAVQEVHKIDFEWYNTPPRTYTVDVTLEGAATLNHISDDTGKSSLVVPSIAAQTITIKLVDTSNVKKWLSIVDVKASGKQLNEPPVTPVPVPIPPQPTPVPIPIPPVTTESVDWFGVQKAYADLPAPYRQWHHTSVDDPLYYEQKPKLVTGTGLDQWLTFQKLDQGRIEVLPMPGLKDSDIETFVIDKVIKKGYLHLPRDDPSGNGDWGDIEMTIAIRNAVPGSGSFESHFEFVRGGFRQTNDTTKCGKDKAVESACEAFSLHSNTYPKPGSDRTKFEKDSKHTDGYTAHDPEFPKVLSKNNIDQKAGYIFKTAYYRVADSSQNGGYSMKLEQYVSTDGLAGKKLVMVGEYLDNGKWGPAKKAGACKSCGAVDEFPIHAMDICCPGIRIDFMKSFEFGKFSIRSIDPKKKLV